MGIQGTETNDQDQLQAGMLPPGFIQVAESLECS